MNFENYREDKFIFQTGMMSIATLAVEYMSKEKGARGGILVNIAQNIDFRWTAQLPVYTATKYAIVGLSQSLAVSEEQFSKLLHGNKKILKTNL